MRGSAVLLVALAAGCTVPPAPLLTLPPGHPGHADSGNVLYQAPPDPFREDAATTPAEPVKGGHEGHEHHGKGERRKVTAEYPLEVCVVSGEKLGSMGKPIVLQHNGREVRLCCPGCVADFKKDPDTYMKKLDEAGGKKAWERMREEPHHDSHGGHP